MKKYFYLAATALALASCADDAFVGTCDDGKNTEFAPIKFQSGTAAVTRANSSGVDAATLLDKNFVVVGYKGTATTAANTGVVFDHYNVNYVSGTANTTLSNTANWEYVGQAQEVRGNGTDGKSPFSKLAATDVKAQTIKYWDHAATSYDFLAFSMGKGNGAAAAADLAYAIPTAVNSAALSTAAYTLTGDATTLGECYISDITTVEEANYTTAPVVLNFRHLTSKARIALYETVPGYVVKDVKFRETLTDTHAAATSNDGVLIGSDAFNDKGTLTVYFPTTGTANKTNKDYNKAHISFTADATNGTSSKKTFGAVNYKNDAEDVITAGTTYLAQTSSNPSYCGNGTYYKTVLPNENASKVLSIQIDYTLVSTDGSGEEINVYGARADVPAAYTAWKSGYAYTYIFKISQNTNGHTGTSVDDKGLTAISFDAVVLDDEATGLQETITTVAAPSITTYGYKDGACTINGGEYATDTDIYATVQDGTDAKAPTNLYTVTIEDNAAQTINEVSIANAIKNGTRDATAKTYTVTDANVKKLVVTDATGSTVAAVPTSANTSLTVPALKWTAGASGTIYAVEYVKAAVAATYTQATGTAVAGTTYYQDATGTALTTQPTVGDDVTSYYVLATPAVPEAKYYKIVRIQ